VNGKTTLYVDQWNNHWFAKTAKELREKIGQGGHIQAMYRDNFNGQSVKIGYIVGPHWCIAFKPIEIKRKDVTRP